MPFQVGLLDTSSASASNTALPPGAVFLSANTRADTLEKFLVETRVKLRARAIEICEGDQAEMTCRECADDADHRSSPH